MIRGHLLAHRCTRWEEPWGGATFRAVLSFGRWQLGVEVLPESGWLRGRSYFLALLRSKIMCVRVHLILCRISLWPEKPM